MSRTFEQVSNEPQPGDEAVLVGGQVVYSVKEVLVAPGNTTIHADRKQTCREAPYTRTKVVSFHLHGWHDLVRHGAVTVRSAAGQPA